MPKPKPTDWIHRIFDKVVNNVPVHPYALNLAIEAAQVNGIGIPKQITGFYVKETA